MNAVPSSRDELQKLLKTLSNQVSTVFQFYEQNTDTLDLATCTLRSATSPSIADMLEWLQDANSYYRQQYPYLSNAVGMQIPCMISLTWQGGQMYGHVWNIWLLFIFPQLKTDS